MFSIADLLDAARARANIPSDYRLAQALGITRSAISSYRMGKSYPDDRTLGQLCALAGLDVAPVAAEIQGLRSQSPEGRTMWHDIAARLRGGATTAILAVCFALSLIALPQDQARASTVQAHESGKVDLLYIVFSTILTVGHFLRVRLRVFPAFFRLCLLATC